MKNALFSHFQQKKTERNGYRFWTEWQFPPHFWKFVHILSTFGRFEGPRYIIVGRGSIWEHYECFYPAPPKKKIDPEVRGRAFVMINVVLIKRPFRQHTYFVYAELVKQGRGKGKRGKVINQTSYLNQSSLPMRLLIQWARQLKAWNC